MIFLNLGMLFGLLAVAVPILIHLLKRGKAEKLPWGAMQFLLASMATHHRRILVEEVFLLAVRCLLVALVVLAMAQPFLSSAPGVPWAAVLPMALGAAICAAVGAALWSFPRIRNAMFAAATALLLIAGLATALERWVQRGRWSGAGGSADTVILIDASDSMNLVRDGKSNFQWALDEARRMAAAVRPADAISIHLAGPMPVALIARPTSDREEVRKTLDDRKLAPLGGSMGVLEAMNAAAASLAAGHNPVKRIVLISDGQDTGWNLGADAQWEFVVDTLQQLPTRPKFILRRLPLPESLKNVAVTDIVFQRAILGVGVPVKVDVGVYNAGAEPAAVKAVTLSVDGTNVATLKPTANIPPGTREMFRFETAFTAPGPHTVTAVADGQDDLAADNTATRIAPVLDRLPVLVVDGAPSARTMEGASAFMEIALSPRYDERKSLAERIREFLHLGTDTEEASSAPPAVTNLVAPTVIPVTDLAGAGDLSRYPVVILANVPRLPEAFVARLADFVKNKGGLLVVPGHASEPDAYAAWRAPGGEPFLPARLVERRRVPDAPERLAPATFSHPALRLLADTGQSDAGAAVISAYWELEAAAAPGIRVGGWLACEKPFLVEREFGQGYILMISFMLDRQDSNLPSLKAFVPLMHELVYYLAAPMVVNPNIRPGVQFAAELAPDVPSRPAGKGAAAGVVVVTPSGTERPAETRETDRGLRVECTATYQPGLYRFRFPPELALRYSTNLFHAASLPFVVVSDPAESQLSTLKENDLALLRRRVDLFEARTLDDVTFALAAKVPGSQLWPYLVLGALMALLAEIGLTRWIAVKRRYGAAAHVDFGQHTVNVMAFRNKARRMLRETRK